jgi:alkanesulfonate monooxygenase SsuD/methylene tetrahydromethanopterin reductase-like flavin-dependent oxidoreductase (luciferase family)
VQQSPLDPTRAGVPVIVGGLGPKRTPALAARFAAEYNLPYPEPAAVAPGIAQVQAACRAVGRDPRTLTLSVALILVTGRSDTEIAGRVAAVRRNPAEIRVVGSPGAVVDQLGALAALGVARVYLQVLDLRDLDHLELIASTVMPQV